MKVKLLLLCSITLCFVILFRLSFNTFFAKTPKVISYHTAKSFKAKKPGAYPGKATLVKKLKLPAFDFPVSKLFFNDSFYNKKPTCSINNTVLLLVSGKYILISILRI